MPAHDRQTRDVMITPERKEDIHRRLNRVEGQINGVRRMVDEDRYCVDVLMQLSSVHEALRGVGKIIMRNYLERCATDSIRSDDADGIYDELMEIIYKYVK